MCSKYSPAVGVTYREAFKSILPNDQIQSSSEAGAKYGKKFGRANWAKDQVWCSIRERAGEWIGYYWKTPFFICGFGAMGLEIKEPYVTELKMYLDKKYFKVG